MSDILRLLTDESFLQRVQQAVITRALVSPSGTPEAVERRVRYNNAVMSVPARSGQEAARMVTHVLQNSTVQGAYTNGGAAAIVDADISFIVETRIEADLTDLTLVDYALAITASDDAALIQDIAGALAGIAVQYATSQAYNHATLRGATMRAWLRVNVSNRAAVMETATRIAHLVLSDAVLIDALSVGGMSVLTATMLRNGIVRVLDAIVALEGLTPSVLAETARVLIDARREAAGG